MEPELENEIVAAIKRAIPDAEIRVMSDDGTHFGAIVVSSAFDGLMLVKQHQMVMNALKANFDSERLHALQLKTYTPSKWQETQAEQSPLSVV